ncbi:MAG: hypothetical protein IPL95_07500 [Saprospiraceae bacterium]|nr:hypothetical protein [Saprospiraceae bacterium]
MENISKYTLFFCYALMIYVALFFYPKWNQTKTEATLSWDVSGYYMYLPAMFIYKDLKHCGFRDKIIENYTPSYVFDQAFIHPKSQNYVMKYAIGQSILMSPYFFIAHIWASNSSSYPPDGFSYPYQVCIGLGMFLYALIGLFFLRKILKIYFKDSTVAILLVAYVFGSNYLNYTSVEQCMTHNTIFALYVFLIYFTILFYRNNQFKYAILIGICSGLATLIRPTEIISLIIPLAWNIKSFTDIKNRFSFILENIKYYLLAAFVFGLIVFIQLFYWKYVSGEWIVYSYQDQGFDWKSPHTFDYMFSYKCGWLIFTPMMILALISLFFYPKSDKFQLGILAFIILNIYIVTAWSIWDYGGTAGRAMIQSYPILAFPFANLIEKVNQKIWKKVIFYIFFILFLYVNLWWTYNAHRDNIQVSNITKRYFWSVIWKTKADDFDKKYLDNKHSYRGYPTKFSTIYENNFEQDSSKNSIEFAGSKQIKLSKDLQFTQEYFIPNSGHLEKWIRTSADIHCTEKEWDIWSQAQFIVRFYKSDKEVQTNYIRIQRFIEGNETKNIFLDARPPKDFDKIGISIWNANSNKELFIDNLKVITFNE